MIDDDDLDGLRTEVRLQRRYRRSLFTSPDCRDPDHPGCPACNETHNDNEEN